MITILIHRLHDLIMRFNSQKSSERLFWRQAIFNLEITNHPQTPINTRSEGFFCFCEYSLWVGCVKFCPRKILENRREVFWIQWDEKGKPHHPSKDKRRGFTLVFVSKRFWTGVPAWRTGNRFALTNFVLIPNLLLTTPREVRNQFYE